MLELLIYFKSYHRFLSPLGGSPCYVTYFLLSAISVLGHTFRVVLITTPTFNDYLIVPLCARHS